MFRYNYVNVNTSVNCEWINLYIFPIVNILLKDLVCADTDYYKENLFKLFLIRTFVNKGNKRSFNDNYWQKQLKILNN